MNSQIVRFEGLTHSSVAEDESLLGCSALSLGLQFCNPTLAVLTEIVHVFFSPTRQRLYSTVQQGIAGDYQDLSLSLHTTYSVV
jgi:hypothetical protein